MGSMEDLVKDKLDSNKGSPIVVDANSVPHKQKMEFSKKIIIYAAIINTIVVFATLYVVVLTLNPTPMAYLIPSIAAEVATGTAFYYTKAKRENTIRLLLSVNVPITEKVVDSVLR